MNDAIVLGIETSGVLCSVAWFQNNRILLNYDVEQANAHATLLAELVNRGQDEIGLDHKDISLVAVGSGPGSFTGLRIGMAFAKGYCYGRDIPLIDVSHFEILAFQAQADLFPVITLIEARKDHYYTGVFSEDPTRLDEKSLLARDIITQKFTSGGQIVLHEKITGGYFREQYSGSLPVKTGEYGADIICRLAHDKFTKGRISPLADIEPIYLQSFAGVL